MTPEQTLADHEARIAALEARQPSAHDTPETNPFMGRGPVGPPKEPISEEMQQVFGFWADPLGRRLIAPGTPEESVWLTKQKLFERIVPVEAWPMDAQAPVDRLVEHYSLMGEDGLPEIIDYNGQQALVFPGLSNTGYGTPRALMIGLRNFLRDALDGQLDWTIEQIEKRRAK